MSSGCSRDPESSLARSNPATGLWLDSIQKIGPSFRLMSSQPPLPDCPQCHRRIAAWKKDHCVYCGAAFPPDFKRGYEEPEALKWVDRPSISPDAARKLEMMKVVPLDGAARTRSLPSLVGLLSLPVFAILFYLLSSLLRRYSQAASALVLVAGAVFLGYLVWALKKLRNR
jgi:hypothetical protein